MFLLALLETIGLAKFGAALGAGIAAVQVLVLVALVAPLWKLLHVSPNPQVRLR